MKLSERMLQEYDERKIPEWAGEVEQLERIASELAGARDELERIDTVVLEMIADELPLMAAPRAVYLRRLVREIRAKWDNLSPEAKEYGRKK